MNQTRIQIPRRAAGWAFSFALCSMLGAAFAPSLEAEPVEAKPADPELQEAAASPGSHSSIVVGERLEFDVKWGFVNAGRATLSILDVRERQGELCYRVVSTAISNSVFDKIYPVRDRFVSYMDAENLQSWFFEKHLREGKYRNDEVVQMDHERRIARYHDGEEVEFEAGAKDVLSAFYYVRTLPLEPGAELTLDAHTDKKNYPIRVKVLERETVRVGAGEFDCIVVEPTLKSGAFFKNDGNLKIWLTDDERRIPVLMKSKIPVGSIAAELVTFERPEPDSASGRPGSD